MCVEWFYTCVCVCVCVCNFFVSPTFKLLLDGLTVKAYLVIFDVKLLRKLTEGGAHDFSLLPRRLHWPSDSNQLSDLQAAELLLGLSQLLQLSDWVEASLSPITGLCPSWRL